MKVLAPLLPAFFLAACSGGGGNNGGGSTQESKSCQTIAHSHTGCCSGHGGIDATCATGSILAGDSTHLIFCADGSQSGTCVASVPDDEGEIDK